MFPVAPKVLNAAQACVSSVPVWAHIVLLLRHAFQSILSQSDQSPPPPMSKPSV